MTWARLDDGFWRNPKIMALNDRQFRLYVLAISYAGDYLTDGKLSTEALRLIGLHAEITRPNSVANALANAGLLDREGKGYRIHDYLDYNPTRADVQAKRAADAERKRRQRHGGTDAGTPRRVVLPRTHTPDLDKEEVQARPTVTSTKSVRAIRAIINGHSWDPETTDAQSMADEFRRTTQRVDHQDLANELEEQLLNEWEHERRQRLETTG